MGKKKAKSHDEIIATHSRVYVQKYGNSLPVRFTKYGEVQLSALVKFHGTTRSDVIRQLVHNEYESLKGAKVIK